MQHVSQLMRRCSHTLRKTSYLGPTEDVTETDFPSLPPDTSPHTFYYHSLFLDDIISEGSKHESQRCTVFFAYASLSLPGVVLSAVH